MSDVVEFAVKFDKKVEEAKAEFLARQIPPGGVPNIPPLLEARRFTHGVPNGAFGLQAAFDVCLVWQLPRYDERYGDTLIYMPESTKKRISDETPSGVLVSAGMKALDHLRSNGIDIGHVVSFIRQAPWRMPIDMIGGKEVHLMILRSGDITGSEDLRDALARGECRIEYDEENSQHLFVDAQGKRWNPTLPFLPADY